MVFCRWKLLSARYEDVLTSLEESRASLERILEEPVPEQVSVSRLRQRLKQLQELGERLAADRDEGIVLIRRTGDLQIELD